MSQDYFHDGAPRRGEGGDDSSASGSSSSRHAPRSQSTPQFMTVGTGGESRHAGDLMAQLEHDSGYGSMAGDLRFSGNDLNVWEDELLRDRPTPAHTPQQVGQPSSMSENEKKVLASHVHQLYYNQNRVALAKAISQTVELLKELQDMNSQWPATYPTVQRAPAPSLARPGLLHAQSTRTGADFHHSHALTHAGSHRPSPLRRAETSLGEDSSAESSAAALPKPKEEPRLVTPQIAHDFSILKLDLKVGSLSQAELVHSLEKKSIASLLDGKISASVRHLLSLRDRIEDTSSKVLVTGDLNAGKSTFCNALLRRKVLPEDQQPCTALFCEVLDAKENGGIEEVHAVHKDMVYNRNDESTYDTYTIQELEKIVTDDERYMQCKVYVKDIRSIDESLLNNGVVDIALIDAPGLNSDSVKTTAVFARQEEIDVVVFVVSAANHFTLSAKEFIWQAAHEKAYIFMVVNGFDNIRDKERCQRMILEQLSKLSPQTFKEAEELVHFVSSNAIPVAPLMPSGGDGGGDGAPAPGRSSGPSDDDDEDDEVPDGKHGEPGSPNLGKGKGKDKEKIQDFGDLEGALRRFVLEKRARSKLAPARTYLLNCLGDLNTLATVNRDVSQAELDRVSRELSVLSSEYEEKKRQKTLVSEQVERDIDGTVSEVFDYTRSNLSNTIANIGQVDLGVEYPGFFSAFTFAEDLRVAMLDRITDMVRTCEDHGRARSIKGVNMVKTLGLKHVGSTYEDFTFRADMMYQRKRDILARTVDTDVDVWDFFDVSGLWEKQEKMIGTGMAMTVAGAVGTRALGSLGWVDGTVSAAKVIGYKNLQRLIVPGLIAGAVMTVAYMVSIIPQTLPPRLARKLSETLATMDYTHSNATRISAEVRRALRYPGHQLTVDLSRGVEEVKQKKEEVEKIKRESDVARKYFGNLLRDSSDARQRVQAIDLESPPPGQAGAYV